MEIFQYLVDFMRSLVEYSFLATKSMGFPSYGIAIILLTIVIKLILAPLTQKQVQSMKGMADLQPKMKAIQDKYKDNPQKAQQEIMKMYKDLGHQSISWLFTTSCANAILNCYFLCIARISI